MSWFETYACQGLEIIRHRFGAQLHRIILTFSGSKPNSLKNIRKLEEVGQLVGLNATEVAGAATAAKSASTFPFWLKLLLAGIAIAVGALVIRSSLYQPGTLYASLRPNDFLSNS